MCSPEQVNWTLGDTIKLEFTSIVCFMQRCTDADQLPRAIQLYTLLKSHQSTHFFSIISYYGLDIIRFCIIVYSGFTPLHCNLTVYVCSAQQQQCTVVYTMKKNLPKTLDQLIFCKYTLVFSKYSQIY